MNQLRVQANAFGGHSARTRMSPMSRTIEFRLKEGQATPTAAGALYGEGAKEAE